MVIGMLADINAVGQVAFLVQQMQAPGWADFWKALALVQKHFADVGLAETSIDLEIWQICQAQQLILITDNRNQGSPDSLEAAI
jgi:predicted nuclease of predicted toxin-antitoxin system